MTSLAGAAGERYVIHLEGCEPEQHPSWLKVPYQEAADRDATYCEGAQDADGGLFPDEPVWVEVVRCGGVRPAPVSPARGT